MEEHLNSLAVNHLLQHTLRSFCIHENSQWVYAVFWRILPRNFPPPKWDSQGVYDRSRGNRRNWILAWEDGFCNFASSTTEMMNSGECTSTYGNREHQRYQGRLQPEVFFKMSHEIHNYGEGYIGKVAADQSHKWIYKEQNDQEINFASAWHNSADSHPRTWEAQFQSGLETIALIAVREGVIQLGAVHKIIEDLSYVVLLRKKFSYIESIPGVLLPHPSSAAYPFKIGDACGAPAPPEAWHIQNNTLPSNGFCHHFPNYQPMTLAPSMTSLEALLSKLPSVVPASSSAHFEAQYQYLSTPRPVELEKVAEEEFDEEDRHTSGTVAPPYHHHHHHYHHHSACHNDLNGSSSINNNGC